MLLSVVVYNHTLTPGQWLGGGIVFAGITLEAWMKRQGASSLVLCVRCQRIAVESLQKRAAKAKTA